MEKIKNVRNISLIFFIVTGILHFGSSILIANEIWLKEASILNKTMDVPLAVTGLLYAFSSLRIRLSSPEKDHKKLDIILICVIIFILIGLIAINLFVPELTTG